MVVITLFSLAMAAFGIAGELFAVPEWVMFVLFLAVFVGYERALGHVWRLVTLVRRQALK